MRKQASHYVKNGEPRSIFSWFTVFELLELNNYALRIDLFSVLKLNIFLLFVDSLICRTDYLIRVDKLFHTVC